MSVAVVVQPLPSASTPGRRRTGVELYALHKGLGRLIMIEKYESEQRDRSI